MFKIGDRVKVIKWEAEPSLTGTPYIGSKGVIIRTCLEGRDKDTITYQVDIVNRGETSYYLPELQLIDPQMQFSFMYDE